METHESCREKGGNDDGVYANKGKGRINKMKRKGGMMEKAKGRGTGLKQENGKEKREKIFRKNKTTTTVL